MKKPVVLVVMDGVGESNEELGEELISNYPSHQKGKLQPYEARVFLSKP